MYIYSTLLTDIITLDGIVHINWNSSNVGNHDGVIPLQWLRDLDLKYKSLKEDSKPLIAVSVWQ